MRDVAGRPIAKYGAEELEMTLGGEESGQARCKISWHGREERAQRWQGDGHGGVSPHLGRRRHPADSQADGQVRDVEA